MKHTYLSVQIVFLAYCCLPYITTAQTLSHFSNVEYITSDNGLSQNEITCILQDQKGFLWFGTRGGLNRYDGHDFKIFQNEIGNVNSLSNNSIESLFEDSKGNIWIGTKSNGISRYNPEKDRFVYFQKSNNDTISIRGNRIVTLAESQTGEMWAGSWENGLTIIDVEKGSCRYLLDKTRINKIIQASDGKMWVATPDGLYVFSSKGLQLNQYRTPGVFTEFVEIIENPKLGKFYLGTWTQGFWEFDIQTQVFKQHNLQIQNNGTKSNNNVYRLYLDNKGFVWIGSWNEGLNRFNTATESFSHFELPSVNRVFGNELYQDVLAIFCDKSGVLWLGTNGGGICKVDERSNQFGLTSKNTGTTNLPNEPIWSILKDRDGVLWVGQKGSETIYYSKDGLSFSSLMIPGSSVKPISGLKLGVRNIFQSRDGTLWFSANSGLYKIVKSKQGYEVSSVRIQEENPEGLSNPTQVTHVTQIYQTTDGAFWIGQQQRGLKRSIQPGLPQNQIFKSYSYSDAKGGIKSNRISALLEDKSGRFWVGTYNGLNLYRPSSDDFLHYAKKQGVVNSLSSDIIICLFEDKKGNLWIGTPNGLNLAIPGIDQTLTFLCFQEKDGLPNNYIHAILEDGKGNLWISTNKGISKFNPDENVFYNFDVNDGLQSNSFMEGVALRDKNGLFFFGGINGLNIFHPDSIRNNTAAPTVVLTSLKIFDKEVRAGDEINNRVLLDKSIEYSNHITLTHKENVFSIGFAALNFQAPTGNSYKYKMEGLEDQWNNTVKQRSITYSNLGAGKYTFKVKAANNSGIWSEHEAELDIEILPPFWATWQAFLLYAILFVGLLILYSNFIHAQSVLKNKLNLSKIERKKELELTEMKTQFYTNITHELRTPLTLITGPVEALMDSETANNEQKNQLATVRYHTRRLLNLVNQLLDFRKAESGNMQLTVAEGDFVKYSREIFLSFKELAEKKSILFQFNVSNKEIPLSFDRDKMEIVVCNLLSNAIKYTPENRTVTLSLRQITDLGQDSNFPKGYCELIVEDTGEGMSSELIEKIFDRFYQIANTNSVKLVGTGIGLALVKNIVELHKGKVFAQSEVGKGSKFTIQLPLGQSHFSSEQVIHDFKNSEDESHYKIRPSVMRNTNIAFPDVSVEKMKNEKLQRLLIVEDNPEIRSFIKETFVKHFNILEAENGQVGLNLANKYIPDLIISDVMMPEMDGITLCRYIKENDNTAHIPFIVLTARTGNVFKVEGYHSGADAYVTKPFHPSVLRAQVDSLLISRKKMKEYFGKMITLQPRDIEISSLDAKFLTKVLNLVEDNLDNESLSRDFLASSMAMSPSSLYRKLKSLTDLTTNAFIRSVRLKRAAQMMQNTQYNVSEIAFEVGFNDLKYFRKCFRDQFGVNPSDYIHENSLSATHSDN